MLRGRSRHPWAARYGVAALVVALAFAIRALLDPIARVEAPFLLLSAAVLVGAAYGGFGPGMFATILAAVLGDYFFLPPIGTFAPPSLEHVLTTGLFVVQGLAISAIGAWLTSARRQAEESTLQAREDRESLRESEERYRLLVKSAEDYAIFAVDPEGRVTNWNPGAERIFGYQEEEMVGEHGSLLFTPEDLRRGAAEEELRRAREEGRAEDERWHVRKDGSRFWASSFVRPVRDEAGNLRGFTKVARDITERKEAEDERERLLSRERAARERLATVLESITDAFFTFDREWHITYTNPQGAQMVRRPKEELLGRNIWELFPDLVGTELYRQYHRAMRENVPTSLEWYYPPYAIWIASRAYPSSEGLSVFLQDVTERKRAEEALREVREAERSRMARDLHDGPLQDLTYASSEVQIAKMISEDAELGARLEEAIDALKRGQQEMRGAVYDLHLGGENDRPLPERLTSLVEETGQRMGQGRQARLEVEEGFPSAPVGEDATELLRVVREALNNARRHSGARNVCVRLWIEGDELVAEVEDDGRGFDPNATQAGMGTRSMRERAAALGGQLEVESEPGKGTTVRLRAPMRVLQGER